MKAYKVRVLMSDGQPGAVGLQIYIARFDTPEEAVAAVRQKVSPQWQISIIEDDDGEPELVGPDLVRKVGVQPNEAVLLR